jgi:hypothetical protein
VLLALAKLVQPGDFERFLAQSLHVSGTLGRAVTWAIVGLELALGLSVLFLPSGRARRFALVASLAASAAAVITTILTPHAKCGCFGALVEADLARRLIVGGSMAYFAAFGLTHEANLEQEARAPEGGR